MKHSECEEIVKTNKIWLKIKKFPPWYSYFFYFDTPSYLADSVFASHKLAVHFGKEEFVKKGFPYVGVMCHVRRKDECRFVEALEDVKKKMLICGHPDYEKECIGFLNEIMKAQGGSI